MKKNILLSILVVSSFGLGWWINDITKFANGVISNKELKDNLNKYKKLSHKNLESEKKIKEVTLKKYISNEKFIHWETKHQDTTNYMCEISLSEITVLYWYHGQCAYDYFTYLTSDTTLDVFWLYRTDCILNMNFLEKSNGIKNHPKLGDKFATFILINDSTLKVNYDFLDWIEKVNNITNDSLFPTYYYLKRN